MDIQGHIIDHWVEKMLDHLAKLADVRCLSSEEQEKYDESIKAADDYYGVLMSYYMNGIDEGVAKGEARGSHHKSLESAKKMMAKGMDENTIMEITGLTQEEIRYIHLPHAPDSDTSRPSQPVCH